MKRPEWYGRPYTRKDKWYKEWKKRNPFVYRYLTRLLDDEEQNKKARRG